MPRRRRRSLVDVVNAIHSSGLSIYVALSEYEHLFLEASELETLLLSGLTGLRLNYPLRTRSKVLKSKVCEILGYPTPASFNKTQPRFPGQNFDTYIQKSDNLQIWNEEVSPLRRYVIIRLDSNDVVTGVRVISGSVLAALDKTGTLTRKFQAKSREPVVHPVLVTASDTANVTARLLSCRSRASREAVRGAFKSIRELFNELLKMIGHVVPDPGRDQERNRGAGLHKAICERIIGSSFSDAGQFPDIIAQLLEIKLQTSPTIDLGLVSPVSKELLTDFAELSLRRTLRGLLRDSGVVGCQTRFICPDYRRGVLHILSAL